MTENHKSRPFLPYSGEYFRAEARKFAETIVIVHNYGGNKYSFVRLIEWLNALGFDCVAFNLSNNRLWSIGKIPVAKGGRIGHRHIWTDEIETILRLVAGKKIVYSFSGPTISAISAIARDPLRSAVALVCDGGPFIEVWKNMWNVFSHEYKVNNPLLRLMMTHSSYFLWGKDYKKELHDSLNRLSPGFPVLSIRGWKDRVVPVHSVEAAFRGQNHLDLQIFDLPEAGHLRGFSDFESDYKKRVKKFLLQTASSIT